MNKELLVKIGKIALWVYLAFAAFIIIISLFARNSGIYNAFGFFTSSDGFLWTVIIPLAALFAWEMYCTVTAVIKKKKETEEKDEHEDEA